MYEENILGLKKMDLGKMNFIIQTKKLSTKRKL